MSGFARRVRRSQLVRASSRDEVLVQVAQRVQVHEEILKQVVAALHEKGIVLEQKTATGLVVPPGVKV